MSKGKDKSNYYLYTLLATVFNSFVNLFHNIRYLFKHRLYRIIITSSGLKLERLNDIDGWKVHQVID
jgi:hypothetical protein